MPLANVREAITPDEPCVLKADVVLSGVSFIKLKSIPAASSSASRFVAPGAFPGRASFVIVGGITNPRWRRPAVPRPPRTSRGPGRAVGSEWIGLRLHLGGRSGPRRWPPDSIVWYGVAFRVPQIGLPGSFSPGRPKSPKRGRRSFGMKEGDVPDQVSVLSPPLPNRRCLLAPGREAMHQPNRSRSGSPSARRW
jgi:hypothetical protein